MKSLPKGLSAKNTTMLISTFSNSANDQEYSANSKEEPSKMKVMTKENDLVLWQKKTNQYNLLCPILKTNVSARP